MRTCKLSSMVLALVVLTATGVQAITIDMVTVGNPGNDPDTTGYGAVGYAYTIGTTEVTNTEYTAFLNATDAAGANPNGIYSALMTSDTRGGIAYTSDNPSGLKYTVKTNMGNKPVNFVSFYDAARFTNWLQNGQGNGSTETGAYTMGTLGNGGVPNTPPWTHNADAKYWLPTENEWYKAAYYDPNKGGTGGAGYYLYPTKSDLLPTRATANATGDISNPGPNVANYNFNANWNGQFGNVTTVGSAGAASASAYGTFDQGGNVWEWNESVISGSDRGLRAAGFDYYDFPYMLSSYRGNYYPTYEYVGFGFRVASVPEPGIITLLVAGAIAGLVWWRRRK